MSLEEYITDIIRVPMLTCEEEILLGTQVQKMMKVLRDNKMGDQILQKDISIESLSPEDRKTVKIGLRARSRIISANMRLVIAVAKKAKTTQIHLGIQDLIQEGAIGLARAAEKFEPGRGYKFSTYAYWWIRQGITRATEYQERAIRLPSNVQKIAKQIKDVRADLTNRLGRPPMTEEIAEELNESVEKIKKIILVDVATVSLDSTVNQNEESSALMELIPSSSSQETEDAENYSARIDIVLALISALPEDEQTLMRQRYGIGCNIASIKQVSEATGISEQAIRQKQQKIINKIRLAASVFLVTTIREL